MHLVFFNEETEAGNGVLMHFVLSCDTETHTRLCFTLYKNNTGPHGCQWMHILNQSLREVPLPLLWMKAFVYVMICMIGVGILRVMAFPLSIADSWCLSGNGGSRCLGAHTSCDAKSFCASLYHRSSSDVVDFEKKKAHLKDVYETALSHAYYSGDTSLALLSAAPSV